MNPSRKISLALLALAVALSAPLAAARRAKAERSTGAEGARRLLTEGHASEALLSYKKVLDRRDNAATRCEYAFVLAKLGMGDAALAQLDLAAKGKRLPASSAWFEAKILRAAGLDAAADELGASADAPSWLKKRELNDFTHAKGGDLDARFLNANRLAAQDQPHLAASEFSAALSERGDALGWIGLSMPLEKLGAAESAKKALEKASSLAHSNASLKNLAKSRLAQLKAAGSGEGDEELDRRARRKKVREQSAAKAMGKTMLFGGGSFGGASSSLNGRFGYFLTPSMDAAVDLSYTNTPVPAGAKAPNPFGLGLSGRYYWPIGEKAGAVALGGRLAYQAGVAVVTVSPGFTSPQGDLFLDITGSENGFQIGITVGATTYFGGGQ